MIYALVCDKVSITEQNIFGTLKIEKDALSLVLLCKDINNEAQPFADAPGLLSLSSLVSLSDSTFPPKSESLKVCSARTLQLSSSIIMQMRFDKTTLESFAYGDESAGWCFHSHDIPSIFAMVTRIEILQSQKEGRKIADRDKCGIPIVLQAVFGRENLEVAYS